MFRVCSCRLIKSPVDFNPKLGLRLSLLESAFPFVRDSVETKGALPDRRMLSSGGVLWWSLWKLSWSAHGQGSLLEITVA